MLGHLPLPRQRERLERHRLQRAGRPLRASSTRAAPGAWSIRWSAPRPRDSTRRRPRSPRSASTPARRRRPRRVGSIVRYLAWKLQAQRGRTRLTETTQLTSGGGSLNKYPAGHAGHRAADHRSPRPGPHRVPRRALDAQMPASIRQTSCSEADQEVRRSASAAQAKERKRCTKCKRKKKGGPRRTERSAVRPCRPGRSPPGPPSPRSAPRRRPGRRPPRGSGRAPSALAKPRLNASSESPGLDAAAEVERQPELPGQRDHRREQVLHRGVLEGVVGGAAQVVVEVAVARDRDRAGLRRARPRGRASSSQRRLGGAAPARSTRSGRGSARPRRSARIVSP